MKNSTIKSLKASNGITLIALVITIIVLLILAGISISMPCFIKVSQLDEKSRPNSENVVLYGRNGIFAEK